MMSVSLQIGMSGVDARLFFLLKTVQLALGGFFIGGSGSFVAPAGEERKV